MPQSVIGKNAAKLEEALVKFVLRQVQEGKPAMRWPQTVGQVVWALSDLNLSGEPDLPMSHWPYLGAIERLGLALALGVFVGLERQRRGKEAGVRTFAFTGLIGCLGGLLGDNFALVSLGLVGLLVTFLTLHALRANHGTELTTAASLLVIAFTGVLCGRGHSLTPVALGVVTAALLAWKEPFKEFSLGLTEDELRSAILLAILAFVIYPALPEGAVDPWGIIEPRAAWLTVLLIAGIGFANYILLKTFARGAVELTGFFGGLVNSTVTVTALAERVQGLPVLVGAAYRGILLANAAMVLRNGALLAILAPEALAAAAPALVLMFVASLGLAFVRGSGAHPESPEPSALPLQSPFSLRSALKFGLIFLALQVMGTLAEQGLGQFGFYAISLVGGFISSASAVASAGTLAAQHTLTAEVAGKGAVIASLTSTLVDLPVVARIARERNLTRRIAWALGCVLTLGLLGSLLADSLMSWLSKVFAQE
jgi:uncharacterized membrane protein (DUF4010 family)